MSIDTTEARHLLGKRLAPVASIAARRAAAGELLRAIAAIETPADFSMQWNEDIGRLEVRYPMGQSRMLDQFYYDQRGWRYADATGNSENLPLPLWFNGVDKQWQSDDEERFVAVAPGSSRRRSAAAVVMEAILSKVRI
jgi:hypothetical protein